MSWSEGTVIIRHLKKRVIDTIIRKYGADPEAILWIDRAPEGKKGRGQKTRALLWRFLTGPDTDNGSEGG